MAIEKDILDHFLSGRDPKEIFSRDGLVDELKNEARTRHRFEGSAGGRKTLRDAVYMPALVATRFNNDFKEKYDQLIKAGNPPKLAITVFMRKLVVLANALIRDNRKWSPKIA